MPQQDINKQKLIENIILSSIEQRIFKEGDRLLSVRRMADSNHMSITPVLAAYRHLEDIGVLEARSKSGFYVAAKSRAKAPESYQPFDFETDSLSQTYFTCSDPAQSADIRYRYSALQLPQHLMNRSTFFSCMSKAMSAFDDTAEPLCYRRDSEVLTGELSRQLLGLKCIVSPDSIRLTFGFSNAILLALQSCCSRGDVAAVECPGLCDYYFAAKLYGIQLLPIRSDPETGLDLDELERAAARTPRLRCIICAPDFSNPTGSLMPPERKRRLAAFCVKNDIVIIENDLVGDFCYTGARPSPVKSLAPEQVIYISALAGSLTNVCYISGGRFHKKLKTLAELAKACVPAYTQEGLALYIQSAERQNHMHFLQKCLGEAADAMYTAVINSFPAGTKVARPQGGLHMWVELPDGFDAAGLLPLALEESVSYGAGQLSAPGDMFKNCLRLNLAIAAARPEMIEGVHILGRLFRQNAP